MSETGTKKQGSRSAGNDKVKQTKATMTTDAYNKKKAEINKKLAEARKKYNQAGYKRDILDGLASGVSTLGGLWGKDSATAPVKTADLAKKNARLFMETRAEYSERKRSGGISQMLEDMQSTYIVLSPGSSILPSVTQLGKDIDAVHAAWRASGKTFKEEEAVYINQRNAAAAEMRRLKAELTNLDKTYNAALTASETNNEVKKETRVRGGSSGGNDGSSGSTRGGSSGGNDGSGGSTRGGSSFGGAGGATGQAKEEVLQTDENGNKLIRVTDANGNQSFVVEDKDKNRKSIKDDEIKKTSVKPEDIQEAIQKGDWKTLLALFLKAIGERDQQAQLANNGQGNAPVQQTGPKEYRTNDGDVFTVTKDGENIISISMQENGKTPFSLTADELKKYGVEPKDVEKMLENKQFNQAGGTLLDVGYKTGKIIHSPEIEVKGNDIILKDHHTFTGERKEPLVLNEQYLVEKCGMKKGKAEKAMENLRELAKSGNMKQSATLIVAQYFSKESPTPKLPDVQTTYGSPKLNRNPGGKIISITVKDATGKEKELGYKDFAKAFNCSPEEAKKLRKECARAIQNGKDVNGVLSFVAENSEGKSKFWTKTATKVGTYVVGAAAVGVGVYAVAGGFKKKDNEAEQNDASTTNLFKTKVQEVTSTDIGKRTDTYIGKSTDTGKSTGTDTGTSTDTATTAPSENDSGKSGGDDTRTTTTTNHSNPITPFIKGGNTR